MITYDQQNKFYNQLLGIVEKMGRHISAHGNLHGNIDESKVLEIIGELQDDEYYSIDDEYHDLEGGII